MESVAVCAGLPDVVVVQASQSQLPSMGCPVLGAKLYSFSAYGGPF